MKSYYELAEAPVGGVSVKSEGAILRVFFDYKKCEAVEDAPDMFELETVDVTSGRGYGDVVNAIIVDRYPADARDAVMANYEDAKDVDSDLTADKRAEYIAEYKSLQAWRRRAKEVAGTVMTLIS